MKPLLRGHSHQAMFFITLGAGVPLILKAKSSQEFTAYSIYIVCALCMFGISALYHRINWSQQKRLLLKKLDHSGIYLMIAGTFTPLAVLALSKESSFQLLVTIWAVSLAGIIQAIFFVNIPKMLTSLIYIGAGYLVLPYLSELSHHLDFTSISLIVVGGVLYTIGGICYGLRKPRLFPKVFGYHEIFHVFVNLGAISHFFVVNSIIK